MKHLPYLLCFVLLSGCISTQSGSIFTPGSGKPIVDTKGVNMAQYELDLQECSTFAEDISTGKSIAKGAVTGADPGEIPSRLVLFRVVPNRELERRGKKNKLLDAA